MLSGQTLTFSGNATDTPSDTLTFSWDFGNGDTANGQVVSYQFVEAGSYVVTLTVADDDESVTLSRTIVVETANQDAPIVDISAPLDGVFHEASTFTLTAFDPDGDDQFTYLVDWGDGTSDTFTGGSPLEVTHTYTEVSPSGKFEIRVSASDGELTGGEETAEFGVLGWTIMPDPVNTGEQMMVVVGSEGNDNIKVWDFWGDWFKVRIRNRTDQVRYKGLTDGEVESILVFGHGGNDRIDIGWSFLPATIWGGEGNDRLRGGWGNDIILGGAGNDRIFGEWGRDILIGGTGADRIHGDQQDDILIAGFTAFDEEFNRLADPTIFGADRILTLNEQRAALESIMDEWDSTRAFSTRRHNIMGIGNSNRTNDAYLKTSQENMADNTVFDDDAVDTLWGNGGIDWFFGAEQDRIKDKRRWEAEADLDKWWDD